MASKVWLEATLKNGHIKFIDYDSFQQITPLPTQRRASSSSNLFWAIWGKDNKIPVALKTWKSNCNNIDHNAIERFVNELTLLSKVNFHANVIRFFGMSQHSSSDVYFLVMQYANGGTLRQYLQRNFHQLTWHDKIRIIKETATGLQCIHNEGMAHKNLHPNNVLVHDGRMMISDLGFSDTWHDSTKPYHDEMIPFLEPLFLQNNSYQRDKRSDIYSLGVIMCEVSSGRPPFESTASNFHLLLRIIMNGERESSIVPGAPLQYVQLYRHCWDGDPISRPNIQDMLLRLDKMRLNSSFVKPGEVRFKLDHIPSKNKDENLYLSHNNSKKLIKRSSHPNISPSSPPQISSRMVPPIILDSTDTANGTGDYVVIDKEELAEYIKLQSNHRFSDGDLPKRRRDKGGSLSFDKFKSSRISRASFGEGSSYMQQEGNSSDEITFENLSISDIQQPQVILIARYAPKKKIISAFETSKKKGDNLKSKDIRMKTAIHALIWNNDLYEMNIGLSSTKYPRHNHFRATLKCLCSNGVDINSKDEFGWTPLHEAIWKRREPGTISALLDYNANPNIPDNYGSTSLHQCLNLLGKTTIDSEKLQLYGCIKLLLSHGANPNISFPDFTLTLSGAPFPNSLFAAVYLDLPLDIIELMVKKGGDVNSTSFRGLYLLDFAAKVNNTHALKYLTDNKNYFGKKNIFNTIRYSAKSYNLKHEKSFGRRKFNITT
ncbi:hypothetical protein RclHR1_10060011 [Rhizophagus clarus]|uniref:Kinase-like domain-containing protein n=1 Tax=Rhizophagus clarus TaxID=94130 RepID=A0A2Z6QRA1_9GLOM|nr:hypothetical protein RclHR1_10060011 [Rhizophagus clarus]GES85357.1 kinase-like domain-containing protein [Rhizophagus clarus]